MGDLYVSPDFATTSVIRVDGICYYNAGPSDEPPQAVGVQGEFATCDACEGSSSSSSNSSSQSCYCNYECIWIFDCSNPDAGWVAHLDPPTDCGDSLPFGWSEETGPTDNGDGTWSREANYKSEDFYCDCDTGDTSGCGDVNSIIIAKGETYPNPCNGSSSSSSSDCPFCETQVVTVTGCSCSILNGSHTVTIGAIISPPPGYDGGCYYVWWVDNDGSGHYSPGDQQFDLYQAGDRWRIVSDHNYDCCVIFDSPSGTRNVDPTTLTFSASSGFCPPSGAATVTGSSDCD